MGERYISDHTRFIAAMKKKDPAIEDGQRKGRALLWDKRVDLDEVSRFQASEVQQPAYVYQNYVGPAIDKAENEPASPGTPAANKS